MMSDRASAPSQFELQPAHKRPTPRARIDLMDTRSPSSSIQVTNLYIYFVCRRLIEADGTQLRPLSGDSLDLPITSRRQRDRAPLLPDAEEFAADGFRVFW